MYIFKKRETNHKKYRREIECKIKINIIFIKGIHFFNKNKEKKQLEKEYIDTLEIEGGNSMKFAIW